MVQATSPVAAVRLGVIYSPNDYSDAWKVPRGSYVADGQKGQAYRMGTNWYVHFLPHWRRGHAQAPTTPKPPGTPQPDSLRFR